MGHLAGYLLGGLLLAAAMSVRADSERPAPAEAAPGTNQDAHPLPAGAMSREHQASQVDRKAPPASVLSQKEQADQLRQFKQRSEWIKDLESDDSEVCEHAIAELAKQGKAAFPHLKAVLLAGPPRAQEGVVRALLEMEDQAARREVVALLRLALSGPHPGDRQTASLAMTGLRELDGSAPTTTVSELRKQMLHRESAVAAKALSILVQFDIPLDEPGARRFVEMLRNDQPAAVAAVTLAEAGLPPRRLLKGHEAILMESLNTGDASFRKRLYVLLRSLGAPAVVGAAAVDGALKGASDYARYRLAALLHGLGHDAMVGKLAEALACPEEEVRAAAGDVLKSLAVNDPSAVTALASGLRQKDADARQTAARLLKEIGPAARPATAALCEALRDPDPVIRGRAGQALCRIGAPAVPSLVAALGEQDVEVRRATASILGRIGPAAREALPALRRALQDPDAEVRLMAKEAQRKIEGTGK